MTHQRQNLILDAQTVNLEQLQQWQVKPAPFVLERGFEYPEQAIYLNQEIGVEANGRLSVYRQWFQDYTRETITRELETEGLVVRSVWNDRMGTEYTDDTEWIGVVAQPAI